MDLKLTDLDTLKPGRIPPKHQDLRTMTYLTPLLNIFAFTKQVLMMGMPFRKHFSPRLTHKYAVGYLI